MANITTAFANSLIGHATGKTGASYTQPTTYVGLFTTTPTIPAGTGGVEVSTSGTAYARVALGGDWGAAASGTLTNSTAITFPTATASWGTIVGFGIFDAATAGDLLWAGTLTTSLTVNGADTFSFPASSLTCSLT